MIDLDDKDWDSQVVGSKEPVIVDFWHESCIWCKRLDPELGEVAKGNNGNTDIAALLQGAGSFKPGWIHA